MGYESYDINGKASFCDVEGVVNKINIYRWCEMR